MNTVGEPYSGKPNVRFDEGRPGEAAPNRAAYSTMVTVILGGGLFLGALAVASFMVGLHWMGSRPAHTMALLAWLPGHTALWQQLARNRAFVAWSAGATVFAVAVSLVPQLGAVLGPAPLLLQE